MITIADLRSRRYYDESLLLMWSIAQRSECSWCAAMSCEAQGGRRREECCAVECGPGAGARGGGGVAGLLQPSRCCCASLYRSAYICSLVVRSNFFGPKKKSPREKSRSKNSTVSRISKLHEYFTVTSVSYCLCTYISTHDMCCIFSLRMQGYFFSTIVSTPSLRFLYDST